MNNVSYFLPDVNDEYDRRQAQEDAWEQAGHVPAYFTYLTTQEWEPEAAADRIADDGLPVCDNPPDIAPDGKVVVIWSGMYKEVA